MRGPKLIVITDPQWSDASLLASIDAAASALKPGDFGVQLRDKLRPRNELRGFAEKLREITRRRGAWLIVNGDAQIAREVGADGVHLGRGAISIAEARRICGSAVWVSSAAHTDDAVRAAKSAGGDAALVSAVFPSGHKAGRGLSALTAARAIAGDAFAIYALGGVAPETVGACVQAGAGGVAVIRAVLASEDPAAAARALRADLC